MVNPSNQLNQEARAYFLQQGQSITKLYDILNSNLLVHHLRNWFSVLVEISLYLLFAGVLLFMLFIPTAFNVDVNDNVRMSIEIEQIQAIVLLIRIVLFLLALPVLLLAILLGRNRRKNNLIRKAFTETEKMKLGFDRAVKDLSL